MLSAILVKAFSVSFSDSGSSRSTALLAVFFFSEALLIYCRIAPEDKVLLITRWLLFNGGPFTGACLLVDNIKHFYISLPYTFSINSILPNIRITLICPLPSSKFSYNYQAPKTAQDCLRIYNGGDGATTCDQEWHISIIDLFGRPERTECIGGADQGGRRAGTRGWCQDRGRNGILDLRLSGCGMSKTDSLSHRKRSFPYTR